MSTFESAPPQTVKTLNVGVDKDNRALVFLAVNGELYMLHAFDAKKFFQHGLDSIAEFCGAHADKMP